MDCLQRNSEITGYRVTYRRTGITEPLLEETLVGTEIADRVFIATGLLPRTSYTFNVMAVNNDSEVGPPATISNITATPEGKQLLSSIFCYHYFWISTDLTLLHQRLLLPNNSIVTVAEIGVDLLALFCFTNDESCCSSQARWLFPDGTSVDSSGDLFQRSGLSMLSLNRAADAMVENGLYQCEIPDSSGDIQTLYAGVYSADAGMSN